MNRPPFTRCPFFAWLSGCIMRIWGSSNRETTCTITTQLLFLRTTSQWFSKNESKLQSETSKYREARRSPTPPPWPHAPFHQQCALYPTPPHFSAQLEAFKHPPEGLQMRHLYQLKSRWAHLEEGQSLFFQLLELGDIQACA